MKVSPLRSPAAGRFELDGTPAGAEPSPRKDLVRIEPSEPPAELHHGRPRPQAAFLAHLLAVAQRAPQTLEKRRAEPQEAINRYAAASRTVPSSLGRALKRAV